MRLGATSEAVRQQIQRCPDIAEGDVLLSNHPAAGGSHLPDMTVLTPVFHQKSIIFWVACCGHHADIGGKTPGSMPANSVCLAEEGVAFTSFKLAKAGQFQEQAISDALLYPPVGNGTRCLADKLSDLKAQVAANQTGIKLLLDMVQHDSLATVQAYMHFVHY